MESIEASIYGLIHRTLVNKLIWLKIKMTIQSCAIIFQVELYHNLNNAL
jgi:hypothetical protein